MNIEPPYEDPFLCPECGSRESAAQKTIQPLHDPTDPWTSVLQTDTCAACGYEIPTHLGECWRGMSAEDVRGEWRKVYRARQAG